MERAIRLDETATVKLFWTGINQSLSLSNSTYHRSERPSGGKNNRFFAFNDTPETITSGLPKINIMKQRKILRDVLFMSSRFFLLFR